MPENTKIRLPERAAPWLLDQALIPVPPDGNGWGYLVTTGGEPGFHRVPNARELARAITTAGDGSPLFAWAPGDRHVRTVFEIEQVAEEVEDRGREAAGRSLHQAVPRAAAAVALIVAGIVFWPQERNQQFYAVLAAIFLLMPLWQRGVEAAWDAWRSLQRLDSDPARWRATQAHRLRFAAWSQGRTSLAGLGLVGLFALVFLATLWVGLERAVLRFGLVKPAVGEGQAWRLMTCAFLHGSFIHIIFNSSAGLSLARVARSLVDDTRILLVFLLSALAGSVASYLTTPAISIGASGGILGWGGLLLGIALRHPDVRETGLVSGMLRWVMLLVVIGIAGAGFIDNAAHAGGFVAGLAMGAWLAGDRTKPLPLGRPRPGWAFWVLAGATVLLAGWIITTLIGVATTT